MSEKLQSRIDAACGNSDALKALYQEIVDEIRKKSGTEPGVTKLVRVCDYVRLERIKDELSCDIEKRGVGQVENNGRQRYWKDNKSMSLLLKYMSQQQSILKSLGLGGVEPSADSCDDDDEDDGFDDV